MSTWYLNIKSELGVSNYIYGIFEVLENYILQCEGQIIIGAFIVIGRGINNSPQMVATFQGNWTASFQKPVKINIIMWVYWTDIIKLYLIYLVVLRA